MCQVERRIYITGEGHGSTFEEYSPCEKARKGRLCSNVLTGITEYYPKKGSNVPHSLPLPIEPPLTFSGDTLSLSDTSEIAMPSLDDRKVSTES
jgi:hypothetical protein